MCGIGGWGEHNCTYKYKIQFKIDLKIFSLSISGLLSTYLIRSGAFQDLELLARIAEPLPQSTGTTATGKSSSKGD